MASGVGVNIRCTLTLHTHTSQKLGEGRQLKWALGGGINWGFILPKGASRGGSRSAGERLWRHVQRRGGAQAGRYGAGPCLEVGSGNAAERDGGTFGGDVGAGAADAF